MNRIIKAFSLIELMVVIAIVAVLAAVALPAYKNYIIKAKVGSALQIIQSQSIKVKDSFNRTGSFVAACGPGGGNVITLAAPNDPIVKDITCYNLGGTDLNALVWATFPANLIPGDTSGTFMLMMVLYANNGVIKAACGSVTDTNFKIPDQYLPTGCVSGIYTSVGAILNYTPP